MIKLPFPSFFNGYKYIDTVPQTAEKVGFFKWKNKEKFMVGQAFKIKKYVLSLREILSPFYNKHLIHTINSINGLIHSKTHNAPT